jgi:HlyD family secretion protein
MKTKLSRWLVGIVLAIILAGGFFYWQKNGTAALPAGFVVGNGRIEATQIDIATKSAGRIKAITVKEGDSVEAGQVIAEMDVQALEAALREAQAQVRRAQNAKATAEAVVAQRRQAEKTAKAIVAQRESELAFSEKQLQRSQQLVAKGFNAPQKLDIDQSQKQSALALLSAAQSQVSEAQAGISAAQSQVIEAQSGIDAAVASVERLQSEIADSVLKAPRGGRVQYRLVEPGEVIAPGGKVVTLVDLSDVSMTVFLPETVAGRVSIGSEARLVLDAAPQYVIPARVSFVASQAQFTPKSVETASERQKLVFQVKLQLDPQLLKPYESQVKTGLPGVATVRVDPSAPWPDRLEVKLPPAR